MRFIVETCLYNIFFIKFHQLLSRDILNYYYFIYFYLLNLMFLIQGFHLVAIKNYSVYKLIFFFILGLTISSLTFI